MQKTAQKRSLLNKLREKTNIGGIAAEKFFNPEFERVMNSLRTADNKARAIISGVNIEGEDAGDDPISLKDLLKNSKSYINRREYMTAIAFLGRFHKKIQEVIKVYKALNLDVDKIHHDFLFKDLDEEQKKHLHDLKSRLASNKNSELISEASIMDFLFNIGTERGRALAAWEKRYPKQIGKLSKDLNSLYEKSNQLLRFLLSSLKEMASYRATRKVDDYMKLAAKIESQYANYDKTFKDFYSVNIKGFLEKQELISPTKKIEDGKDLGKQEINVEKTEPTSNIPIPLVHKTPPSNEPIPLVKKEPISELTHRELPPSGSPILTPPSVPSNDTSIIPPPSEDLEDTEPTHEVPKEENKSAHKKFLNSLETLSGETPQFLSLYIAKYAHSISIKDPQTAKQLMEIAKIIGE